MPFRSSPSLSNEADADDEDLPFLTALPPRISFSPGAQGLVGWWMVRSGLTEHAKLDVDNAEEWQVRFRPADDGNLS